ncbi:hypothetical protein JCM19294_1710 [Nonlabens tegetincola]|uniref:Uncharacterized protein n=1 Tax=Nonlabens tegetincola TaxID=323273 RepID=A0A090Q1X1_9FLAO|nr:MULTISPECIES: hypothetical protein [Nonlabens]MEE2802298.1 hypothetical protein [Bacteroidota bacterium]ALM21479.1 hypothetical protein AAT17_09675 [Nonlabens sp. MIC269]ARN71800.1 hypothetical protein BST91_09140 [Nonlabens tegetincola]PQJ14306.1 hypothetical protein BST93_13775 [Nonlabens tegetincola]GAK96197.1 hypothetical protein JCM19294_1710 [Nonlabens tegetincola]
MASIRHLKQDINYVLGDIIDAAIIHQGAHPESDHKKSEEIIDDSIKTFDALIARVNDRSVENRASHLKQVRVDLQNEANQLADRINAL